MKPIKKLEYHVGIKFPDTNDVEKQKEILFEQLTILLESRQFQIDTGYTDIVSTRITIADDKRE